MEQGITGKLHHVAAARSDEVDELPEAAIEQRGQLFRARRPGLRRPLPCHK